MLPETEVGITQDTKDCFFLRKTGDQLFRKTFGKTAKVRKKQTVVIKTVGTVDKNRKTFLVPELKGIFSILILGRILMVADDCLSERKNNLCADCRCGRLKAMDYIGIISISIEEKEPNS